MTPTQLANVRRLMKEQRARRFAAARKAINEASDRKDALLMYTMADARAKRLGNATRDGIAVQS